METDFAKVVKERFEGRDSPFLATANIQLTNLPKYLIYHISSPTYDWGQGKNPAARPAADFVLSKQFGLSD